MKIHDALIIELIKPDISGKPNGYIIEIMGTANFYYKLEESFLYEEKTSQKSEVVYLPEPSQKLWMTPARALIRRATYIH